ncbi:hypothetical protein TPHA_0G02180 [Tetrapisispora phaffii CBS 4417]|uniref:Meiotic recombination protein REC114 n=1 Tax=Tetrapisispora phaffii (strain ATCC 24235 / CBS 4417 / NBRC 1672 / NRRL Y-8282 / UCD 70-5) TaxID=1071381 RepID=G8BVX6_TETPH|nr:hypothetical protein TPHA_0G02180 [Tetrapisispora phaffii CBS 4417]CCE64054.1 hypothetical protein TPHA_0G02180 [Tetrapisispora phaffii CBS 4417]
MTQSTRIPILSYSRFNSIVEAPLGFQSIINPIDKQNWSHYRENTDIYMRIDVFPNLSVKLEIMLDSIGVTEQIFFPIMQNRELIQFTTLNPTISCKYLVRSNDTIYMKRFQVVLNNEENYQKIIQNLNKFGCLIKNAKFQAPKPLPPMNYINNIRGPSFATFDNRQINNQIRSTLKMSQMLRNNTLEHVTSLPAEDLLKDNKESNDNFGLLETQQLVINEAETSTVNNFESIKHSPPSDLKINNFVTEPNLIKTPLMDQNINNETIDENLSKIGTSPKLNNQDTTENTGSIIKFTDCIKGPKVASENITKSNLSKNKYHISKTTVLKKIKDPSFMLYVDRLENILGELLKE